VNGATYAIGRQPWFVGVASPGATVDLILRGTQIIGAKVIGTVVADAAGNFRFHLPAGLKNGSFTLVAHAHGLNGAADKYSTALSFKIGPAPHIKPPPKTKGKPKSQQKTTHKVTAPKKTVVKVKPKAAVAHQVKTSSTSHGNVVDHALHALLQIQSPFKKKH
jgi:hypothetical protein